MTKDVNVLSMVKGNGERYVWIYCDSHRKRTLRHLGRFAANPELSFSWHDAAVLGSRVMADKEPETQHE